MAKIDDALVALATRVDELEAALDPFARLADMYLPEHYSYPMVAVELPGQPVIYTDDLRRARGAMAK